VNIHVHCIDSRLKRIRKISTLPPVQEKFLRTAMRPRDIYCRYLWHVLGLPFLKKSSIKLNWCFGIYIPVQICYVVFRKPSTVYFILIFKRFSSFAIVDQYATENYCASLGRSWRIWKLYLDQIFKHKSARNRNLFPLENPLTYPTTKHILRNT